MGQFSLFSSSPLTTSSLLSWTLPRRCGGRGFDPGARQGMRGGGKGAAREWRGWLAEPYLNLFPRVFFEPVQHLVYFLLDGALDLAVHALHVRDVEELQVNVLRPHQPQRPVEQHRVQNTPQHVLHLHNSRCDSCSFFRGSTGVSLSLFCRRNERGGSSEEDGEGSRGGLARPRQAGRAGE